MSSSNRLIVSILAVAALAIAFWMLLLGPKREEAEQALRRSRPAAGRAQRSAGPSSPTAERRSASFPSRLPPAGRPRPGGSRRRRNRLAAGRAGQDRRLRRGGIRKHSCSSSEGGEAAPAAAPASPAPTESPSGAVPASATVPPTEAAASVLPLGASVGPAGLGVMPYSLTFSGDFFRSPTSSRASTRWSTPATREVAVDGRLVTLDGFALNLTEGAKTTELKATFAVTTYLTPPSQGVTAGATPTEPAPSVATPTSATAETPTSTTEATPGSDAQ